MIYFFSSINTFLFLWKVRWSYSMSIRLIYHYSIEIKNLFIHSFIIYDLLESFDLFPYLRTGIGQVKLLISWTYIFLI